MRFRIQTSHFVLINLAWLCIMPVNSIAQDGYWNKRFDFAGGNEWGGTLKVFEDQLIIAVNALCDQNTRICTGLISVDTSGGLNWKSVLFDSLSYNYVESIHFVGDTIYANMNYRLNDSLQFTVLRFDPDSGQIIDRFNYFKDTLIPGSYAARGISGYEGRIFVEFAVITDGSVSGRHWIRAYDLSWNELWEVSIPNTFNNPAWSDIEATPDGGMVVAYTSWQSGTGDRLGTIEKYDSTGDMEWQTNLPYLGDFQDWMRIDLHPDGGYVGFWWYDTFAIQLNPQPNIVFKLDQGGEIEWQKVEDFYEIFFLWDLFSAQNGDIIACGTARYWPVGPPQGPEYEGAFLVRYNKDGERLWDRKILMDSSVTWNALYGGAELLNGDLVFTGEICDTLFGTPDDPTPCNVWVIKVDSNGCFEPDCGEFQHLTATKDFLVKVQKDIFAVFPNPTSDEISIAARLGDDIPYGNYSMHLYDMYGRLSFIQEFDPNLINQFDISQYVGGMYYLVILRDGHAIQAEKVIIVE